MTKSTTRKIAEGQKFNTKKIWDFLKENSKDLPLKHIFKKWDYGNCYGELCKIWLDNDCFEISYGVEIEDDGSWAQAECFGPYFAIYDITDPDSDGYPNQISPKIFTLKLNDKLKEIGNNILEII